MNFHCYSALPSNPTISSLRNSSSHFWKFLGLPLPSWKKKKQYPEYLKEWRKRNPKKQKVINDRSREKRVALGKRKEEHRTYSLKKRGILRGQILDNLRRRLRKALKGEVKSERTIFLLGCPVAWLELHIESLFKPGMTWENYGSVWHIDHIRPCANFNLTDSEHQRWCFHWTNLQPLFAEENRKKGDTWKSY